MTLTNIDTLSLLPPLSINLGDLRKGISNDHVDVRISPRFAADVRRLATALTQQATTQSAEWEAQALKKAQEVYPIYVRKARRPDGHIHFPLA